MREICGKSHGKLILMGEHSVVYGQPSIALPFRVVTIQVKLEPAGNYSYLFSDIYEGPVEEAPKKLDALVGLFNRLRHDFLSSHDHFLIKVNSNIPVERGLGSSAALSVAFIRAFFNYLGKDLSNEVLLDYADFAETISHGTPSGLDARVTAYNQPLYFKKGETAQPFHFHTPYWLVIADTGISGNTKQTVKNVRDAYESPFASRQIATQKTIKHLGLLTTDLTQALKAPQPSLEKLAALINAAQHDLAALQVSSPELSWGIDYMRQHGAVAAKLTGGGGGGCYYALVPDRQSGEKLIQALADSPSACQSWLMPFSSESNTSEKE
ncbi:mevalonate kinase [Aerococcus urinae]|uniref:mevalonate kinase n=1 Tax=Aerococcus urinae TaxID=1376 RepID=UPI00254F2B84|nr:mevalonate kinase [Aerococcus urinae]MDK6449088.1 mevalonate kinase [Aerococcus urinae]